MDRIDFIAFFPKEKAAISEKIVQEYQKGQSVADIARLLKRSKSYILLRLKRAGIESRPKTSRGTAHHKLKQGKQGTRPYYGFCYLEGEVVKDPREFKTLMIIHQRWKDGQSIHEIVKELNRKKVPSRKGKCWSWAAVQNIVKRFEQGSLKLKNGGQYEF